MLKRLLALLSDTAFYGASGIISQLLGFLLLPLYTRCLSPVDYGVLSMLAIVTSTSGPIADLGMTSSVFRRYLGEDPEGKKALISTGMLSVLLSSAAVATLGFGLSRVVAGSLLDAPSAAPLVRLVLLTVAVSSIASIPSAVLRAERRVALIASINITKLLLGIGATVFFVVKLRWGVAGVLMGTLLSEVAGTTLLMFPVRSSLVAVFDRAMWRWLFDYGVPFVPHKLLSVTMSLFGQFVVRRMVGLSETGLYDIAAKFCMPVSFAVAAFQRAWVAFKYDVFVDAPDPATVFRSLTSYYVGAVGFLAVLVSSWAPEALRFLTPGEFHMAARLISPVVLVPVATSVYWMLGTGFELTGSKGTRPAPFISLAGLVSVVGLSLFLIPRLGATGAALATAVGWAVMATVVFMLAQRRFPVEHDWAVIGMVGAVVLVSIGATWFAQPLHFWARAGVGCIATASYPVLLTLTLLRSRSEHDRIARVLEIVGILRAAPLKLNGRRP